MTTPIEFTKHTRVPDDSIVMTVKLTDPYCARPFQTFSICGRSGVTSPIVSYVTAAAALHAHAELVRHLTLSKVPTAP